MSLIVIIIIVKLSALQQARQSLLIRFLIKRIVLLQDSNSFFVCNVQKRLSVNIDNLIASLQNKRTPLLGKSKCYYCNLQSCIISYRTIDHRRNKNSNAVFRAATHTDSKSLSFPDDDVHLKEKTPIKAVVLSLRYPTLFSSAFDSRRKSLRPSSSPVFTVLGWGGGDTGRPA